MRGSCVICGGGIAAHHETTTTRDGRAHLSCKSDDPDPPVVQL